MTQNSKFLTLLILLLPLVALLAIGEGFKRIGKILYDWSDKKIDKYGTIISKKLKWED